MRCGWCDSILGTRVLVQMLMLLAAGPAVAQLQLGPEQFVQADGVAIGVPGYSVPRLAYWDGDDLPDLIVGQGSGTTTALIRVYLNTGTSCDPTFSDYLVAQSNGADLILPQVSSLNMFPSPCERKSVG